MAKEILKDITIRNAKHTNKDLRLNDGGGLYLLLKPNGAKWWRFDYTFLAKRKTISLGTYPAVTLADAREKARSAANLVANQKDPSEIRKTNKAENTKKIENEKLIEAGLPIIDSFEYVAREWGQKK